MSVTLDTTKLPEKPGMQKATWGRSGRSFGTYYVAARSKPSLNLEKMHPEVVRMIMRERPSVEMPPSGSIDTSWHGTDWDEGAYVSFSFVVPHEIDAFSESHRQLPEEVGHCVSAHLQLGEHFGYMNFRNFERGKSLKFLPFLITPKDYRFFVYHPTPESVQRGAVVFREVLERVKEFEPRLSQFLRMAYARVRLNEVGGNLPEVWAAENTLKERMMQEFQLARALAFVYKDLPGPQDAVSFSYEMNAMYGPEESGS
ncbi:MAG: hypothetical protein Athens041674_106 [Parcubacteria group bacterium Athens0416_74]|nr:MAG: hypothetical protein Athens041674_106 [Parcubacteria group bacterium Athens0416_74]